MENALKCTYCQECKKKADEGFKKPKLVSIQFKGPPHIFHFYVEVLRLLITYNYSY